MTTNNLDLSNQSSINQEQNLIENFVKDSAISNSEQKSELRKSLKRSDIPYQYYDLINDAFDMKNFKFAEILLNRIPFDVIFPEEHQQIGGYNVSIKWFINNETFNFLFQRARKARKINQLRSAFKGSGNLAKICTYGTFSQFKLIATKTPKNYWFLKNSWCLTNAIASDNYLIVKELIKIAKSCKFDASCLIREQININEIYSWFFKPNSDLRSLKLIKQEFPEIDLEMPITRQLSQSIISEYQYRNKEQNLLGQFKKIARFFQISKFNFCDTERLLQRLMFDRSLFFFVYRRVERYELGYTGERCFLSITQIRDSDVSIDPEVGKFILRQNLKILLDR
jgi:hypothetical protein